MPRADQTSQAETPGATSFGHPRDLSHEENLAAALSSFLSQLNSCLDVPRLDETVDVTDSLGPGGRATAGSPPSLPPVARSQGLKRVLPAGALERSLYDRPAPAAPPPPASRPAHDPAAAPTVPRAPGPVVSGAPARPAPAPPAATQPAGGPPPVAPSAVAPAAVAPAAVVPAAVVPAAVAPAAVAPAAVALAARARSQGAGPQ